MAADVVIALDVGGTTIKAGLVTRDGSLLRSHRHPTGAEHGPEAVRETILHVAAGLVDAARADGVNPRAVGVAVPGVVDDTTGVAVWSANLGLRDAPLRDEVAAAVGLPVALGHDIRAGGVAEARLGAGRAGIAERAGEVGGGASQALAGHAGSAGRAAPQLMFVAVGTGIAAAQVVGGQPVTGAHGAAGELGHVVVRPNGPPCACGARGCLEAVASATAVVRRYAELARGAPAAASRSIATPAPQVVDAAGVAAAVAAGDERAIRAWREAVEALADGLVTGQALYDVELIVLGGGLAEAGDTLLAPLRTAVKERLTFHREPQLVLAQLGDLAGCLGAGLLAWDTA